MKKQRSEYSELLIELVKRFGKNPESLKNAAQTLNDIANTIENAKKNKDQVIERAVKYYEDGAGDVASCISWAHFDILYESPKTHKKKRRVVID